MVTPYTHFFEISIVNYSVSIELLIAIYRAVSSDSEPSVIGDPTESIKYIIGALQKLVGISLDHIDPNEILQYNDRHLYDLAEIFLGLLDIVDEEYSKNVDTDDTDDLCQIDSGNTMHLNQTPSEFVLEPPQCPFSPIMDASCDPGGVRTKFPEIVNSSFSGSEIVSVDIPVNPDQKDSSRSYKTNSSRSCGKTDSSKSLMLKIESKIHQTKHSPQMPDGQCPIRPKIVTQNLTPSDIEWTETGKTSDLINTNNSSNKPLEPLEISDIEKDVNNLVLTSDHETAEESEATEPEVTDTVGLVDETDSMQQLLLSLQKTVDNSKRVREEYAKQKRAYDLSRSSSNDTAALCLSSERELIYGKRREKKARRKRASKSNKAPPEDEFKKVLEREKQLEQLKQGLLVDEFKGQLQDIEDEAKKSQKKLEHENQVKEPVNEVSCQTSPIQTAPAPSARTDVATGPMEPVVLPRLEIGDVLFPFLKKK